MNKYRLIFGGETGAAWTFYIRGDELPLYLPKKHVSSVSGREVGKTYVVTVPDYIAKHHLPRLESARVKWIS